MACYGRVLLVTGSLIKHVRESRGVVHGIGSTLEEGWRVVVEEYRLVSIGGTPLHNKGTALRGGELRRGAHE